MSDIRVEWIEVTELPADKVLEITSGDGTVVKGPVQPYRYQVCDFCSGPLPEKGVVAMLQELNAIATGGGTTTVMTPPWALCPRCSLALGLSPGDGVADLEGVRSLYREKTAVFLKSLGMEGVLTLEVYGTG